ncbi:phage portal protein [Sutcliffiella halmapala]|uniref:phage portal protein n=1 Tax=Sutcliffiella halmapala TaxID=79882 RepID=UPI0009952209|nr:phage portal protein [Sutcliffiella halmapala]
MRDFFNKFSPKSSVSLDSTEFLRLLGIDSKIPSNKLSEVTYFTCLRLLSESVSKLPLKMYQDTEMGTRQVHNHPLIKLLKIRPNPYMTPSTFWGTVEINRNHYGNSYVYINSDLNGVKDLWILPTEQVQVWIDNAGIFKTKNAIWYIYTDAKSSKMYKFRHDEIMHFKTSVSLDGIMGLAIKDILKVSIENAQHNGSYLNNYYKNGLMGKAVVHYTGDLDLKAGRKMAARIEDFASGTKNAGKIIPLPFGFSLQPLNISMADAQFLEISKYTALQIAGAFGIKPSMINNYDKGNYANVEMQQHDFYINTLLAIIKPYEEETSFKLISEEEIESGHRLNYNTNVILRADFKTQMEGLAKAVGSGLKSPNESRRMLGLPQKEGGDELIVNGTFIKLKDVGKQYGVKTNSKGGENEDEVAED